jgi:hypothetical protein
LAGFSNKNKNKNMNKNHTTMPTSKVPAAAATAVPAVYGACGAVSAEAHITADALLLASASNL